MTAPIWTFVMLLVFVFLVGVGNGFIVLGIWFANRLREPKTARAMLRSAYKAAHPHWLQPSATDPTRVCPLCGWNEAEGSGKGTE